MFIGGASRERPGRLVVRNPYTEQVVGTVSADVPEDVEEAVAMAKAYDGRLSVDARAAILRATAEALAREHERFASLITAEAGVCVKESRREVDRAVRNLAVAAEEATRLAGEALPIVGGDGERLAVTVREPVGVVAAITPFNRPLNQVVVKVAPAIASNNAVVVKPSEKAPLTALAFARLVTECGLPPGVLGVVTGRPEDVGEPLVEHHHVDMVTFTGGVSTGARLAQRAGLKKLVLELGGNDPLIVLKGFDMEVAAKIAVAGAYATAGQSCRGVKRVIVLEEIADELVDRLVRHTRALRCGDPFDPLTDVGPVIATEAAALIERRIAEAVAAGARRLCGGWRRGALLAPTVLDHVPPTAELVVEETFGPVAPVIRVADVDEAIQVANSTPYGLQAGVLTVDIREALHLARRLRVGGVMVLDGPTFDSPHIPFGGVKRSGFGREGIRYTMQEMTTVKTVVLPWAGWTSARPLGESTAVAAAAPVSVDAGR